MNLDGLNGDFWQIPTYSCLSRADHRAEPLLARVECFIA